jgi:hypothetical protein
MLQQVGALGTHARLKRDASRPVLAWPLRHRPLPDDAGYVPFPEEKFEQGFLDGYGPAQVGFGSPFSERPTPFETESTTPAAHAPPSFSNSIGPGTPL